MRSKERQRRARQAEHSRQVYALMFHIDRSCRDLEMPGPMIRIQAQGPLAPYSLRRVTVL